MCGVAGYLEGAGRSDRASAIDILRRMGDALVSRGPDGWGVWQDASGIGLAHRRLAIVDLSSAGHQPMASSSGRYVLVFNGEVYNHRDLREELRGVCWRGRSDTETLLAAFERWGVERTLQKSIGMFSIGLWDCQERELTLARDRLGEKPLYYGWMGSGDRACFLFGSELKALKAHPSFAADIDRDALCLLMRHNYIPAPYSIYRGIFKLEPGAFLRVSAAQREPVIQKYWSLVDVAVLGNRHPFAGSDGEAVDALDGLLRSAILRQMMADVPLGAFLSGGIDSSTIVALMQAQSGQPVKTFTIGFSEAGYNEAVHAQAVARHLGTEHTELYVSAQQALEVIPNLSRMYCEPFADSSQVPTALVSALARQKVTVSLSGDAGDELFAGYNRYALARNLWGTVSRVPVSLRAAAQFGIQGISPSLWNRMLEPFVSVMPRSLRMANLGDKLHKAAGILGARNIEALYLGLVSHWEPDALVIGGTEPKTLLRGRAPWLGGLDDVPRMMVLDGLTYLPDDILCKVDRAAMAVSLESRVPFLDHRVVEFAWRIPQSMKMRDGMGKWILRQVLYRYVPRELVERPKMGFGVPLDSWLRGPLRDWAEALLEERRLRREGYLNPGSIRQKWAEHLSGKRNWQYHLWDVLMFQSWLEKML